MAKREQTPSPFQNQGDFQYGKNFWGKKFTIIAFFIVAIFSILLWLRLRQTEFRNDIFQTPAQETKRDTVNQILK